MKKIFIFLLTYALIFNLFGCSSDIETTPETVVVAVPDDTSPTTTPVEIELPTDNGSLNDTKANYNGDTPDVYNAEGHLVAVRSYAANPFGLYDMGGNVWE